MDKTLKPGELVVVTTGILKGEILPFLEWRTVGTKGAWVQPGGPGSSILVDGIRRAE